ncbi:DUF4440 domain-containing protein [Pyruvatibacter sp.]|uniref:nuclear transport factor 2 family protein n=1 Tax=Pyruvatibacter sp. TaxID=1981328 RepID=UPI0032EB4183
MNPDEIRALEERLLSPEIRADADALNALLDDAFVEFGASGRVHTKADVIDWLAAAKDDGRRFTMHGDFAARLLSPDIALATYTVSDGPSRSLRSSIWTRRGGAWRLTFNQGTPVRDES